MNCYSLPEGGLAWGPHHPQAHLPNECGTPSSQRKGQQAWGLGPGTSLRRPQNRTYKGVSRSPAPDRDIFFTTEGLFPLRIPYGRALPLDFRKKRDKAVTTPFSFQARPPPAKPPLDTSPVHLSKHISNYMSNIFKCLRPLRLINLRFCKVTIAATALPSSKIISNKLM